ncbi:hypothetical protein HOH45_05155, partial [bacterium]|nr:hypothetical protein [bacterium]
NLTSCTRITNVGLAHLSQATSIDLWGCSQITDEGLKHLTQVTSIDLTNTNITDAGLAHFKTLNPTCKIIS